MASIAADRLPRISGDEFLQRVEFLALKLSRLRKANIALAILDRFLDDRPSTHTEMAGDWRNASVVVTDLLIGGSIPPDDLGPECYQYVEDVWLDEIKSHLAYCKWFAHCGGVTSPASSAHYYFQACEEIRGRLLDSSIVETPAPWSPLQYLGEKYLTNGKPDPAKVGPLIERKSARLSPKLAGRAQPFVQAYYGNIMDALDGDPGAVQTVLKSLRHGGSAHGEPSIVNGLETMLVVRCLDPDITAPLLTGGVGGLKLEELL